MLQCIKECGKTYALVLEKLEPGMFRKNGNKRKFVTETVETSRVYN